MTHRHLTHAQQVADRFKNMLSESGRQHVGQAHFDELSLLIESAISSAVLEELESAADKMDKLAHELRSAAEHFDPPSQEIKSA
ncbi:MAG: phosphatase [Proteobacteria bacterium]|jgi:predicted Co/Zn/Cd cation transporter (cation efflux family)|nr:phosphatase [Pseudomonadota bacterium]